MSATLARDLDAAPEHGTAATAGAAAAAGTSPANGPIVPAAPDVATHEPGARRSCAASAPRRAWQSGRSSTCGTRTWRSRSAAPTRRTSSAPSTPAVAAAHLQLEGLRTRLAGETDAHEAAIFAAHQELLEDPEVLDRAAARVRAGDSAAHAWRQAYTSQAERLAALDSALLRGRATDLRDVGRRVLHLLVGGGDAPREVPPDAIVVAEDLTPSDTASLDRTRVRGLCTTTGSATSHVAILARGLGIPAIAGADPRVLALAAGTRVVLDGDRGTLDPAPSAEAETRAAERQAAAAARDRRELAAAQEPAVTRDGHRVEVVGQHRRRGRGPARRRGGRRGSGAAAQRVPLHGPPRSPR
jgi:phosphocarrier protein FPr